MAIEITHIRFGGTQRTHDEIVRYKSRDNSNGKTYEDDKPSLVAWVDEDGNNAYVGSGSNRVPVGVVKPNDTDPYLRTHADGKWTNNLLSLPTF
ncbi:DUF3892 domain-containing protein [Microbacterium marinilacus]|uniref:DUF3892 domain-containing protein n=1 Tax=Microbacterium marinilacus TaxID=415209 RepID=A0ABP7BN74_9MICO|nr:DUF3892 domain-containing protein [Microbacterium marinilacus]MBY0690379.1 DUF3892 domain-containing protein [Microbacterium marinilacus]